MGYADGFGISYEMPESGTEAMRSLDGVSAGAPPATSESIAEGLYCFEITNALGGCDESTECDGVSCGIGACGNECPSTCGATEVCSGNTCVCDVANECNEADCGTGFCGGECPNTCNSPLSCDRQICLDTFDGNSHC